MSVLCVMSRIFGPLGGIQTCNLLFRKETRCSVAPRGDGSAGGSFTHVSLTCNEVPKCSATALYGADEGD